MRPIRRVLVPVELGAPDSEAALEIAATLCRAHGAELRLLHVQPPQSSLSGLVPQADAHDLAPEHDQAAATLRAMAASMGDLTIHVDVVPGFAADEILRAAGEQAVDLIVMGNHGRLGMRRLVQGSVSAVVTARAPCPTLTVHAPAVERQA